MSANLSTDSGSASNPNPAASTSTETPQTSAANAADVSAGQEHVDAASGQQGAKTVDQLDAEYRQNMLAPDKREVDQLEPEESTEPETVEAKPETLEAADEVAEEDDLVERTEPRTLEDLKKQFPRVATTALEEIAKVEASQYALQKEVNDLGGPDGLEIAKGIIPALLSPNPTAEEVDSVFQTITETNPAAMQAMSWNILTHALNEERPDASGLPTNIATGNALIKQFLNEKYDVEQIEKLIAFDEAGLIDKDELSKELENFTGKSKRELELEARLKAVEDKGQQDQAAEKTKAEARVAQHVDRTEKYVINGAMSQIIPIAEQFGWTATKEELASSDPNIKSLAEAKIAFGELLTPWLDQFVKSHVKFAGVESLGKQEQAFNADGNPTVLLKKNGQEVINAAIAAFKQKVRILNPTFAKSFGSTRANQLKAKTTRSGTVEPSSIPPVKKAPENGNRQPADVDALDEQYRRSMRESRAQL